MNLDSVRRRTVDIVEDIGQVLLSRMGTGLAVEHKGAVDLVTAADREAESRLVDALGRLLPGAGILAEEGSGRDGDGSLQWIVDPLDGTTNFAHGYPVFCVSVALARDGKPVLGVVHDPTRGETFHAVEADGAWLGRRRLGVSPVPELNDALLVTGFPYDVRETERDNLIQFRAFLKRSQAVRRSGSAALDLAYVATGRFDGYWEEFLAPWDVAAGRLLVTEAGGRVSGYDGTPTDPGSGQVVASNGLIHDQMTRVLGEIESSGVLPPLAGRRRG